MNSFQAKHGTFQLRKSDKKAAKSSDALHINVLSMIVKTNWHFRRELDRLEENWDVICFGEGNRVENGEPFWFIHRVIVRHVVKSDQRILSTA